MAPRRSRRRETLRAWAFASPTRCGRRATRWSPSTGSYDGKKTLTSGSFTWPNSADTGDQLVDDLVLSAEATFQAGCPRVALPGKLNAVSSIRGVSKIDASADALQQSAGDLSAAFVELRKAKVCKK
jgi:hypothetical protein